MRHLRKGLRINSPLRQMQNFCLRQPGLHFLTVGMYSSLFTDIGHNQTGEVKGKTEYSFYLSSSGPMEKDRKAEAVK